MENLTQGEREAILEEMEKRDEKRYKTGKTIVFTIGLTNAAIAVVSFIMTFNALGLIVQLALSGALIYGIRWVRYLQAVNGIVNALLLFVASMSPGNSGEISTGAAVFLFLAIAYSLATAILLIKHKGVDEYYYEQNT